MGRTAHHWHAAKNPPHPANQHDGWEPGNGGRVLTWCGDAAYMTQKDLDRPQHETDCPKCAAALGKAALAKYAGRVELRRPEGYDEVGGPWRSSWGKVWKGAYEFWLDGVLRGYIVCDNGWGKPWELRALARHGDKPWGYQVSSTPRKWSTGTADKPMFGRVHSAARDAMAVAAVRAVEAGLLPTLAEYEAQRAANAKREAEQEAERAIEREARAKRIEQEEAQRQERLDAWRLALESLEARSDLSNLELAGLDAIKWLYKG